MMPAQVVFHQKGKKILDIYFMPYLKNSIWDENINIF